MNEDHNDGTINGIASGLTILGNGTVKYVMLGDAGKLYTMMVEAYWAPELKHRLVPTQDLHTEEWNTMSLQTHYGFEGEERFSELMVKPKVKGYHTQPAL